MLVEYQKSLMVTYAEKFFDEHQASIELAKKVGNSSFFVTGATGLFGDWVLAFLLWTVKRKLAEPRIAVLSRHRPSVPLKSVQVIEEDVRTFELGSQKFDYLLHLAAPSASDTYYGMDDLSKFDALNNGTRNVLNVAQTNVRGRTLVTSSGAVFGGFGFDRKKPIDERERFTVPFDAVNQGLCVGKKVTEFLVKQYCNKGYLDASIARCFSFVGPGLPTALHYAAGNFAADAVRGKEIVIQGDGNVQRSYMYLGDMVFWLFHILFSGRSGEDYNVGSTEAVTLYQLASLINQLSESKMGIKVIGKKNMSTGTPNNHYYVPCVRKANEDLGLVAFYDLHSALKSFVEFEQAIILKK